MPNSPATAFISSSSFISRGLLKRLITAMPLVADFVSMACASLAAFRMPESCTKPEISDLKSKKPDESTDEHARMKMQTVNARQTTLRRDLPIRLASSRNMGIIKEADNTILQMK